MKSEDACCLAQKHSQMSLVRGNTAQCDHSKPIFGATALRQTFENVNRRVWF